MWIRHKRHTHRTKKYRELKNRYNEFRATDCVRICTWHHEEIHVLYMPTIKQYVQWYGHPKEWSWEQINALIAHLRKKCDEWVLVQTPGMQPTNRRTFHSETT